MEAASVQTVGAPTQRRRSKGIPERRLAKLMVAPSMILIAIVAAYPIIYAIWLSLHEYSVRQSRASRAGRARWACATTRPPCSPPSGGRRSGTR